jgi:FlgD Ig-like domain
LTCSACCAVTATQAAPPLTPPTPGIAAVSVTPAFFNPTLRQQAALSFHLGYPARVAVVILDRDREAVRHFPGHLVQPGEETIRWDGTDDSGALVPNEAYTARIEATGTAGTIVYDPAERFEPLIEQPPIRSYSRAEGVLSYTLARPSRVHIQAGQAQRDPRTGKMDGPILKTVVDRQPRVAGSVVEVWNGMDETGAIYVPALPHFAVAILATSLPDNVLIVAGGAGPSFSAYARAHRSAAALRPHALPAAPGMHHGGLTGLEDRSPQVSLQPNGTWDPLKRTWLVSRTVTARITIPLDEAPYFLIQPQTLIAYLDETPVVRIEHPTNPQQIALPGRLAPGDHRLVVNWASSLGPVGLAAARIVAR